MKKSMGEENELIHFIVERYTLFLQFLNSSKTG
jgi:hypothetical protein